MINKNNVFRGTIFVSVVSNINLINYNEANASNKKLLTATEYTNILCLANKQHDIFNQTNILCKN